MIVRTKIDLGPVRRALAEMKHPDLRPAFTASRKPLRIDIKDHRAKREGPSGSWAPRAASTTARARRGRRARQVLGKLPTLLTATVTRDSVKLASRVPTIVEAQERGAVVGHGSKLPPRKLLWPSREVLRSITARVVDRLRALWKASR